MLPMPSRPETPNIAALARVSRDRVTGITGTALTLADAPVVGWELVFKNGALLDPGAAYTVSGKVVTLGGAAISGDVFVVFYWARGTT